MAKKKDNSEDQKFYIQYGIDIKKRKIFLDDEIETFSIGWILRSIEEMVEEDPTKSISITINSFGGSVYDGLSLYDELESLECEIITTCKGAAMSMALVLFLVGDSRDISDRGTFMAHSLSSGSWGTVNIQEVDLRESKRLNGILLDILAKRTKKTKKWWSDKIKHEDFYIDPKAAAKLGITNL